MREVELQSAVSKVKWRVLPLFVLMFIVNYIDRVNISFIKEQLSTEVGVGDIAYGWGVFFFFCSYALLEVPANLALERLGARRWLTIIAVAWGLIATGFAFVRNEYEFYTLRFALGAAEAGFFPGVVYYLTRWLPAGDRGKAMAIFLSGSAIATIISGPLSAFLLQLSIPGLRPWQWMIVIEGAFSVLMAGVLWLLLDSDIKDANWLTQMERDSLSKKIGEEQVAASPSSRIDKWALLTSPTMIGFCGVYFSIQITIYTVTFWLPTIIKEMLAAPYPHGGMLGWTEAFVARLGYDEPKAAAIMAGGFLNSIPWIVSIVGMVLAAHAASRWKNQHVWVAVAMTIAGVGMLVAGHATPHVAFAAICFAALGFKSAASLFWPIPQKSLDPRIAAAGLALINSLGNLGGGIASPLFAWIKECTHSAYVGLYGLALTSLLTAMFVFASRPKGRA